MKGLCVRRARQDAGTRNPSISFLRHKLDLVVEGYISWQLLVPQHGVERVEPGPSSRGFSCKVEEGIIWDTRISLYFYIKTDARLRELAYEARGKQDAVSRNLPSVLYLMSVFVFTLTNRKISCFSVGGYANTGTFF